METYVAGVDVMLSRRMMLQSGEESLARFVEQAGSIRTAEDLTAAWRQTRPYPDPDLWDGAEPLMDTLRLEQRARLIAAALEIAQGRPIPENPTPDSYFYDCFTGGPIRVYRASENSNEIYLESVGARVPGEQYPRYNSFIYLSLPPDHPLLKQVPQSYPGLP
jgi:hypothetical protein